MNDIESAGALFSKRITLTGSWLSQYQGDELARVLRAVNIIADKYDWITRVGGQHWDSRVA